MRANAGTKSKAAKLCRALWSFSMKWFMPCARCVFTIAFVFFAASSAVRAQDQTAQLLQLLSDAPGPPGFEEPVRKIMVERMTPLADHLSYDGLGSVIASQGNSGPRVMIDAHMDELGAVVRRITPDGYLTMQMLGGWLDEALVGQRWIIIGAKGPVRATSGIRDAHLTAAQDRDKLINTRDAIFLDLGAKSADEARSLGVAPGDPIVPDAPFAVLNGTQNYMGKGWDDRVGCAIILEVMRRLAKSPHPNQLFYAATVQEEIGLRGAHTSAEIVKPDVGIALEAGITRDVPGVHPEEAQETLGGGPGIFLYNVSQLPNRKFVALARQTAKEKAIPLQDEFVVGYGDDAAEIQKTNGGAPTITLVVPTRYTHAHNGIISRADYDRTVELLVGIIQHLDAGTVKQLRDFSPAP
jgi:putative aminopeptidase FrvX